MHRNAAGNVASKHQAQPVTCSATDNTNCSGAGNGTPQLPPVSYQWSNGETNQVSAVYQPDLYSNSNR
ncbi:MAG: hypothetical protein IPO27_16655 [Bacteroidetes bacterium]|nr:hypothetical protein [Bacteroidota bacterium]